MLPREGKRVASADQVTRDVSRSWKRNDPDQVAAFFARDAIYTDGPKVPIEDERPSDKRSPPLRTGFLRDSM
jgi:hypothetical protein